MSYFSITFYNSEMMRNVMLQCDAPESARISKGLTLLQWINERFICTFRADVLFYSHSFESRDLFHISILSSLGIYSI